jgi:hypothetical protein
MDYRSFSLVIIHYLQWGGIPDRGGQLYDGTRTRHLLLAGDLSIGIIFGLHLLPLRLHVGVVGKAALVSVTAAPLPVHPANLNSQTYRQC